VQVSMSSSTRCDAVSVSSQLDTHIAEVLAGVTLSVNAFEVWHASGIQDYKCGLLRTWSVKDLTCAAASHDYVERIFSVCGLLHSERQCYAQVSRDESSSYSQSESAKKLPVRSNSL